MLNNRLELESGVSLFEVVIFITLFSVMLSLSIGNSQRFEHVNKNYMFAQKIDYYFDRLQKYTHSGEANLIDGVNEISLSELINSGFLSKVDTGVINDYDVRFFVRKQMVGDVSFFSPLLVASPLNERSFSQESVKEIEHYLGESGGMVDSLSGNVSGNWGGWYLKANDWRLHFDSQQIIAFASGIVNAFTSNTSSVIKDTSVPVINEIVLNYFNVGKLQRATIKVADEHEVSKIVDWTPVFYEDRLDLTIDGGDNTLNYLVKISVADENGRVISSKEFINTIGRISLEPKDFQLSDEATENIINVSLTPVAISGNGDSISFVIRKKLPEYLSVNDIWDGFYLKFASPISTVEAAEPCLSGGKNVPPDNVSKISFASVNKRLLFDVSLSFMNIKFLFYKGELPNIYFPNGADFTDRKLQWFISTSPSFCVIPIYQDVPSAIDALLSVGDSLYVTEFHRKQNSHSNFIYVEVTL